MFKVNDYIIYGTTGICKIIDIRKEHFEQSDEQDYFILQPVYSNNSTIYLPVNNEFTAQKMKPILTSDEIYSLIESMSEEETEWINEDTVRKEEYTRILKKGDRKELVKLIKTLYLHKQELLKKGRKFYASDETILEAAEKLLYNEFALVLNIKPEEVVPFILKQIQI